MSHEQEFGRNCWLAIADELSGDADYLSDLDPAWRDAAQRWARCEGLPFPPPDDIDDALVMAGEVAEASRSRRSPHSDWEPRKVAR